MLLKNKSQEEMVYVASHIRERRKNYGFDVDSCYIYIYIEIVNFCNGINC